MTTVRSYRSSAPARRGDFAQLLHAEWTKFRTVRGWVTGMIVAVLVIVGFGLFASGGGVKARGTKACPPGISSADCRSAAVSLAPPENTIALYLIGTFAGLIAVAVVATMFMSAEYRRGLIRTTLAASPGPGPGAGGEGDRDRRGRLRRRTRRRRRRGDPRYRSSSPPWPLRALGTVANRTAHHRRHGGTDRRGRRVHPRHCRHRAPQRRCGHHRDRDDRVPVLPVNQQRWGDRRHGLSAAGHPGRRLRCAAAHAAVLPSCDLASDRLLPASAVGRFRGAGWAVLALVLAAYLLRRRDA